MKKTLIGVVLVSAMSAASAMAQGYAPEHLGVAKANVQIAQQEQREAQKALRSNPYDPNAQAALRQASSNRERALFEQRQAQNAISRQQQYDRQRYQARGWFLNSILR